MAGLCEGTENIKLRMLRMKAYMSKKPLRRMVSVGVMLGIAGVSTATVMASSVGVARGYSYIADETVEDKNAGKDIPIEEKSEKNKKIKDDNNKIIKLKEKISQKNNMVAFEYKLEAENRIESQKVYIKKGTFVEFAVSSGKEEDGDSKDMEVGIIDEDKNARYIDNRCDLIHNFKINKTGYYRIYIENYGDKIIQLAGICSLETEEKLNEENN